MLQRLWTPNDHFHRAAAKGSNHTNRRCPPLRCNVLLRLSKNPKSHKFPRKPPLFSVALFSGADFFDSLVTRSPPGSMDGSNDSLIDQCEESKGSVKR